MAYTAQDVMNYIFRRAKHNKDYELLAVAISEDKDGYRTAYILENIHEILVKKQHGKKKNSNSNNN